MKKIIPHVSPKYLLLIAGIVWIIAGANILRIGIPDFASNWEHNILYLMSAILIFYLFMHFIFYRLVQKHNKRILAFQEEKIPFYLFFDGKSYLIMIFMITGGLSLRSAHILPELVIGILYCGIGFSLVGAGLLFIQKFILAKNNLKINKKYDPVSVDTNI